jgi:hypothetical protein
MTSPAPTASAHSVSSPRCPLGVYTPRTFNTRARWRFRRDRIARLKADFGITEPTTEQASIIAGIVAEEWAALLATHEGRHRDATEHRRVARLYLQDLKRTLAPPTAAPAPVPISVAERIAERAAVARAKLGGSHV